jgi:aspartyl/asparaginyl-tRNA synthetase
MTEKSAKKPVIVMNHPKTTRAFYMRLSGDGRGARRWRCWRRGSARSSAAASGDRLEVLDRSMAERGIDREHYHTLPGERRRAGEG